MIILRSGKCTSTEPSVDPEKMHQILFGLLNGLRHSPKKVGNSFALKKLFEP